MPTSCPGCQETLSDAERKKGVCPHCGRSLVADPNSAPATGTVHPAPAADLYADSHPHPVPATGFPAPPASLAPASADSASSGIAAPHPPPSARPASPAEGPSPAWPTETLAPRQFETLAPRGEGLQTLSPPVEDPLQTSDFQPDRKVEGVWGKSLHQSCSISSTLHAPQFEAPGPSAPAASKPLRLRMVRDARLGGVPPAGAAHADADYELLHLLGEGGMGVVYAARQTTIDRTIAVKMLKPAYALNDYARGKFLAEAAVTGDLDHPNIVPVHDLGAGEDGSVFYAMKRVRGKPWSEAIRDLSLAENLEVLLRTADAVAFAHSRGVIHRDLKPDNVMLGDFGEVLVMDWGLAASVVRGGKAHALQRTDSAAGTPAYMAPEMAVGDSAKIGTASDVYLLGAILFEIVAGKPPHTGANVMKCMFAAGRNEIVPTDQKGELLDVALAAMAADPADRPASVREFQNMVRTYRAHAESIHLSQRAHQQLDAARLKGGYDDYAQAIFGFREALRLWSGNDAARRGIPQAQRQCAEAAFAKGDFDLARSMLNPEVPEHEPLVRQVESARQDRDVRRNRVQRLLFAARLLGAVLLLTLSVAYFWIRSARDEALAASANAKAAEWEARDAEGRTRAALAREKEASLAAAKAAEEAKEALARENAIHDLAQRQLAQVFLDRGDHAAREGAREAALAWYWRSYDVAPVDGPLRRSALALLSAARPYSPKRLFHAREVRSAAFVGDGALVVTGGLQEGELRRWNALTGEPVGQPLARGGRMLGAEFSPDGKKVVVWGLDDVARLYDTASGASLGDEMSHGSLLRRAVFSPDGNRLLTESGGLIRFWEAAAGRTAGDSPPPLADTSVSAFGPAGRQVLIASTSGKGQVWDREQEKLRGQPFQQADAVLQGVFRPDGEAFLTWGRDRCLRTWEAATGRPLGEPLRFADAERAALSPDGRILFTGDVEGGATFRDPATGKPLAEPEWRNGVQSAHAFSGDGKRIMLGGEDGEAWVWDVASRKPLPLSWKNDGLIVAGALSADGSRMVASARRTLDKSVERGASAGVVRLWDVEPLCARRESLVGAEGIVIARFSADGRKLLTISEEGGRTQLWSHPARTPIGPSLAVGDLPEVVAFSPDARLLATARGHEIHLWNLATGTSHEPVLRHDGVKALAFSPDGETLASGGGVDGIRFWNPETGVSHRGPLPTPAAVLVLAYSADGKTLLAGCGDRVAGRPHVGQAWDLRKEPLEPSGPPLRCDEVLLAAAISPDGRIAATSSADGVVRLWDVATGKPRGEPLPHDRPAHAARFSPDGRSLVTASDGGVGQWWDVASGCRLGGPWKHERSIQALAFGADSLTISTLDSQGSLLTVRLPSPLPDDPELLRLWVEVRTGQALLADDDRRLLSREEWFNRWTELRSRFPQFLEREAAEERAAREFAAP